jgi:hypothetical protein
MISGGNGQGLGMRSEINVLSSAFESGCAEGAGGVSFDASMSALTSTFGIAASRDVGVGLAELVPRFVMVKRDLARVRLREWRFAPGSFLRYALLR